MQLSIGNAPCSWGVEFADDPRNPPWTRVLDEARAAGYRGIELGPLGYMPEDPAVLGPALAERGLTLIGGSGWCQDARNDLGPTADTPALSTKPILEPGSMGCRKAIPKHRQPQKNRYGKRQLRGPRIVAARAASQERRAGTAVA